MSGRISSWSTARGLTAGVRRVGDHAARADDTGDLDDRALLRAGRMNIEIPGHATSLEVIVPRRTIPRTARPVTPVTFGHHPHRRP